MTEYAEEMKSAAYVQGIAMQGTPANPPVVMPTQWSLVVPPGLKAGDTFMAYIDGNTLEVQVPPNHPTGSTFIIAVANGKYSYVFTSLSHPNLSASANIYGRQHVRFSDQRSNRILPHYDTGIINAFCLFGALIMSLLIASFAQPNFAEQTMSTGCGAQNPYTGDSLNTMWYILYKGFCSSSDGSEEGGNFCILWENQAAWNQIDTVIAKQNLNSDMSGNAQHSWPSIQSLAPVAFGFSAITLGLLVFGSVISTNSDYSITTKTLVVSISGSFLIISWACAISAVNAAIYSSTMSGKPLARVNALFLMFFFFSFFTHCRFPFTYEPPIPAFNKGFLWSRFYTSGTSFADILGVTNTNPPPVIGSYSLSISSRNRDPTLPASRYQPTSRVDLLAR